MSNYCTNCECDSLVEITEKTDFSRLSSGELFAARSVLAEVSGEINRRLAAHAEAMRSIAVSMSCGGDVDGLPARMIKKLEAYQDDLYRRDAVAKMGREATFWLLIRTPYAKFKKLFQEDFA